MAAVAFARSFTSMKTSGNIGKISDIADFKKSALRLGFILNPHKPAPFFLSAAEWFPGSGSFMNLENSLGATGAIFPKQTRLVAVSAAEPFGGALAPSQSIAPVFGVRLQSIRKLLLSPLMVDVRDDFPGLYEYMESLSPRDQNGNPIEKSEQVIKRFLH